MKDLMGFILESNRIEGIIRTPLNREVAAHRDLLALDKITVPDLERFVTPVQPGAVLRRHHPEMDVRVGNYCPPRGGPEIEAALRVILDNALKHGSYQTHLDYELLHPFTDGNGRSGRALWLWGQMGHAPLGFLHEWYYQTLRARQ